MGLQFDTAGTLISGGLDIGQPGKARFAGGNADSKAQVQIGSIFVPKQSLAFAGIDGVTRIPMGKRSRTIAWRGAIRALNDTVLNAIETDIETYLADGGAYTLEDSWGRMYTNVSLEEYRRQGPRVSGGAPSGAIQMFGLVFLQSSP